MNWFQAKPVYVMGIVNVTPDSFSDGGKYFGADAAIAHGEKLIAQGADILDIGGESTRPGAAPVSASEEQDRILPVIEALKGHVISVDTRNASTMRAAINAGASMINDVSALTHDPDALSVCASFAGPVCIMHMLGEPGTMQDNPVYDDVVEDVYAFLQTRIDACVAAGITKDRLVVDPGFGFGKTYDHNIALVDRFARFRDLGVPVLAGVSRKRFIGQMMGADVSAEDRLPGSLAVGLDLARKGARILRVHDVAETCAGLARDTI